MTRVKSWGTGRGCAEPAAWTVPAEYLAPAVSSTAVRILLGHRAP